MSATFFSKIEDSFKTKNSLLCIGLDPRLSPDEEKNPLKSIVEKNKLIIEATARFTACYKPNIAFFERYGVAGWEALEKTLSLIPEDIAVLIDAKRGDIGPTAEAYADSVFKNLKADGVTVNAYMGQEAADPFIKFADKAVFVLCRTSNPSSRWLQDEKSGSEDLYMKVARDACGWGKNVGLVVAGNDSQALAAVRAAVPAAWFLSPGIGAQGGKMEDAVCSGLNEQGTGMLPVVVRAITEDKDPGERAKEFVEAFRNAAASRKTAVKKDPLKQATLEGLVKTKCFKLGSFTLKSGIVSPFYIDLRRVVADATVLRTVAKAYATLVKGLKFDKLAGIPIAALPLATALSLELGLPMIYPRMNAKAHGTGNVIEGDWKPGDRVLLLDDLITTGASKLEAIEILRKEGLIVEDLIVLIERGVQGRRDMEAAGVRLRSYAQVEEFFEVCESMGLVDSKGKQELLEFAKKN
jgi:uridine monophosphate synthetase